MKLLPATIERHPVVGHQFQVVGTIEKDGKVHHADDCLTCGKGSYWWHLTGQNFYCCDEDIIKTVPTIGVEK